MRIAFITSLLVSLMGCSQADMSSRGHSLISQPLIMTAE